MKLSHKVNFGHRPNPEPITDAYQSEIDAAHRRAEKAWRKAQKAVERAERIAAAKPDPVTIAARDHARMAVLSRLAELREIEELMRARTGQSPTAVHRTGRDDRLEVGTHGKRRRKKNPPAGPVTTTNWSSR